MPKVTNIESRQHNAFLRRQRSYELKYTPLFYNYFKLVYNTAATSIEKGGVNAYLAQILQRQHKSELESIYRRLYMDVTISEAKTELRLLNGQESSQKDIVDDIVQAFPYRDGAEIKLFRELLEEYLPIRILTRITQVNETTVRHISQIIEKGISEGLGGLQVAALIRKQTDFNQNRALLVARTETVTASNQGKFMTANSSNLVMEKRWIPTNQPGRTRESHLAMLNSPFIDLDQPFFIANSKGGVEVARYPGDETLSAENTCNCRCSIGFRVKRDENGNPLRKTF